MYPKSPEQPPIPPKYTEHRRKNSERFALRAGGLGGRGATGRCGEIKSFNWRRPGYKNLQPRLLVHFFPALPGSHSTELKQDFLRNVGRRVGSRSTRALQSARPKRNVGPTNERRSRGPGGPLCGAHWRSPEFREVVGGMR